MAILLLWWRHGEAPFDEDVWTAMTQAARAQSPRFADQAISIDQAHCRAFALRTFASEPLPLRQLSDGSLVLCSLRHDMPEADFVTPPRMEPAATIRVDRNKEFLSLSRDVLGQRSLVWARVPGGVLVSTREEPLMSHPHVKRKINWRYVAARVLYELASHEDTAVEGLHSIAPGALIRISPTTESTDLLALEPDPWVSGKSERQLVARFRDILQDSAVRSVKGQCRPVLSLSSGFDSPSIAALLHHAGITDRVLAAISYGYDHPGELDERPFARDLANHYGIPFTGIDAMDYPPLQGVFDASTPLNFPELDAYAALSARVCELAVAMDGDVILTGIYADHIGHGHHRWTLDALRAARFDVIAAGYLQLLMQSGAKAVWRESGWRHLVKRLLGRHETSRRWRAPAWLMPEWRDCFEEMIQKRRLSLHHWPDAERADFHLHSQFAASGWHFSCAGERMGIDYRHPYRDAALVRFILSVPAHLLGRPLQTKWIAREALAEILPDAWRLPAKRGMMGPVLKREFDSQWPECTALMRQGISAWESVIQREAVMQDAASPDFAGWWDPGWRAFQIQSWLRHNQNLINP